MKANQNQRKKIVSQTTARYAHAVIINTIRETLERIEEKYPEEYEDYFVYIRGDAKRFCSVYLCDGKRKERVVNDVTVIIENRINAGFYKERFGDKIQGDD